MFAIEKDVLADPYIWSLDGKDFFNAVVNDLIIQRDNAHNGSVSLWPGQKSTADPLPSSAT